MPPGLQRGSGTGWLKNRPFKLVKVLSITSYTLSADVNLSTFSALGSMVVPLGATQGRPFFGCFFDETLILYGFYDEGRPGST